jgi:catechol 2,3-dioxygenase-like lactoylglutathione lyase family enzyme
MSYQSRTGAVLFANHLDRVATFYSVVLGLSEASRDDDHILLESLGFQLVAHRIQGGRSAAGEITVPPTRRASAAFKPVFFVPSISNLRGVAEANGGFMEPADREWSFNGVTVCDGLDPEGNVVQFREVAGKQAAAPDGSRRPAARAPGARKEGQY